jgi:geranylgeranyl pyrophosphate synthase
MADLSQLVSAHNADEAGTFSGRQTNSERLVEFILARLPKTGRPLFEVAAHHFAKPGKMLRAKMALRASQILNVDRAAAFHWAVAIEVLHNASLIHDDICDGDQLRRGRPAVWSKYGRDVALTLGDWLVALSFELAAEAAQRSQTPMLVKILADQMKTTTMGQAREFEIQRNWEWNKYLEIAADKTAPLLTAPLEGITAMALHGNASTTIGSYFRCLGNAYQIANDILNFKGKDGAAANGSDLAKRAPNAVVVLFRDGLDEVTKARFDSWYVSGSTDDLFRWQETIMESSAIDLAAIRMNGILDESTILATSLPVELIEVIEPVQQMLQQACKRSVTALIRPSIASF